MPTYLDLLRVTTQTIVQGINDGLRKTGMSHELPGLAVNNVSVTYRNGHTALRDASFRRAAQHPRRAGRGERFGQIDAV